MAGKTIPEDIQKLLMEVVNHFDREDMPVRERQIRQWRWLKLLWEGFHQTWYSEVAHDWRIFDETNTESDTQQAAYDKPINVFRAYLESIIAALSVIVPPVKCFPDDADNTLDLATARAGDKIGALIFRHNDVSLLWLHALFIYMTEGMVACYSYPKADNKYGKYEEKKYEETTEEHQYTTCPECGYEIADEMMTPELAAVLQKAELAKDEYNPTNEDVPIQDAVQGDAEFCPSCEQLIIPELMQKTLIVTRLIGVTELPKSRICLEAYGGLYVKVANYAKLQKDTPYLIFSYETHYANALERYKHLRGRKGEIFKKKLRNSGGSGGPRDPYEEFARLSPQYQGDYPENIVTCKHSWLRPAAFNVLKDEEDTERLEKLFPNGVMVAQVNDCFAEAINENLDDCWTLTRNPLSDFIHHDPLGLLLVSIQEITNDLISLILQTIEHGIGQTFADPAVLNFEAYRQLEATPGGIFEATPKSGKNVSESFHEVKTASLSPEVMPFAQNIQSLAQLVSGALPSLFGGAIEGSETASQYSMSRAQALQRLQNTWKIFTVWWKEIFGKAIPMYIKEVHEDERDVQMDKNGGFINSFIRKAELEGKIGKVEIEANENLPLTWSQQKDLLMELMQAANPAILSVIGSPENLPVMRSALGLTDFYVPGEDSREKQLDEIKLLLNSMPIPTGDPMMPEAPSVEVDPDYDVHPVEFETVRKWVTSEAGRQAKTDNPDGHRNVLLHGKMHLMFMQQQQMASPTGEESEGEETASEAEYDEEAPITGEENVGTIQ